MANYDDRLADYVDVAERVREFRAAYPDGSLQPLDLDTPFTVLAVEGQTFVVYAAAAYRHQEDLRPGVGCAWQEFPGRTPYTRGSELMNAETSAWGRAIVAALAADSKRIASAEEVRSAERPARATHDDMDRIVDALEFVPDDGTRLRVRDELRRRFRPHGEPIAAQDVDAVLAFIADQLLELTACEVDEIELGEGSPL